MKQLLDFQNIEKENLDKIINSILKLNIQKLKKIDSFTLLQFNESSTRTRLSFSIAAQKLGINVVESQDSISAKEKGESLIHELETFKSMGIEALVIRTKENNLEEYKNVDEISVISGGFGNTSHPTQALVDVATLTKLNKFSYEVPVTYVGDLKHSRVFSSGRELLTKLGFKVGVFSNEELLPSNLDNLCVFNSSDVIAVHKLLARYAKSRDAQPTMPWPHADRGQMQVLVQMLDDRRPRRYQHHDYYACAMDGVNSFPHRLQQRDARVLHPPYQPHV